MDLRAKTGQQRLLVPAPACVRRSSDAQDKDSVGGAQRGQLRAQRAADAVGRLPAALLRHPVLVHDEHLECRACTREALCSMGLAGACNWVVAVLLGCLRTSSPVVAMQGWSWDLKGTDPIQETLAFSASSMRMTEGAMALATLNTCAHSKEGPVCRTTPAQGCTSVLQAPVCRVAHCCSA